MNIIQCAIERENAACIRYEKLAAHATTPDRQELFTLLAAAEQEHLMHLEDLRRDLARHGIDGTTESASCLPVTIPQVEQLETDGYLDVTRAEEASIAFYDELAAAAENPQLRQICLQLAEEERGHLEKIAQIYEFVEGPKTFLAWGEFSNMREL
jgi:rubrerythrin